MEPIHFNRGAVSAGESVSGGWELIKPNYWVFFGMTTLFILGSVIVSCIPLVGGIVFQIALAPPLTVGIYYALFRQMEGAPVDLGMMFKGFDKMAAAVVVGLIQSIPSIIWTAFSFALDIGGRVFEIIQRRAGGGFGADFAMQSDPAPLIAGGMILVIVIVAFLFLLFSIAWGITFFFALPLIADHDIGAMDAIKLSASAGWSNAGGIILLFILEFLLCVLGLLAICFGILFVVPVVFAASVVAYRQVFPWVNRNFNMAPPPPSAYGDLGTQRL